LPALWLSMTRTAVAQLSITITKTAVGNGVKAEASGDPLLSREVKEDRVVRVRQDQEDCKEDKEDLPVKEGRADHLGRAGSGDRLLDKEDKAGRVDHLDKEDKEDKGRLRNREDRVAGVLHREGKGLHSKEDREAKGRLLSREDKAGYAVH